ncbi:MAG: tRNA 2-thiouridine(34) synthase MnmA [Verrucomicrobiae bacterium]|nr:tRNA 2-thiouridine(34) synthase MnmA [Verrucomicrobiae bacterium]
MADKPTIVVGMSGGVDSSVAACLLLQQGWKIIGITLKLWPSDCPGLIDDRCCGPDAIQDAKNVAATLGIPHKVLDLSVDFDREVIRYFQREYQAGRTPNPCVVCNREIKFGLLLRYALALGASHVATGHYARVEKNGDRFLLRRATDLHKDQSYFLFALAQEQLAHVRFPLGELRKEEVRALAQSKGLVNAQRKESQDICFAGIGAYGDFLKKRLGINQFTGGEIVDLRGNVLGQHQGIELYTVGQRKGINVGSPTPLYVLGIDTPSRRVIVGTEDEIWHKQLTVSRPIWTSGEPAPEGAEVMVKIRHSHPGAQATFHFEADGSLSVQFKDSQRAITPGQAAVFYQNDLLIGGGWITKQQLIPLHPDG